MLNSAVGVENIVLYKTDENLCPAEHRMSASWSRDRTRNQKINSVSPSDENLEKKSKARKRVESHRGDF